VTYDARAIAQARANRELEDLPLGLFGVPAELLKPKMGATEASVRQAVAELDQVMPPARSPRTSREAAGSMRGAAKAQRIRVLQWLEPRGDLGGTQEEASDALDISRQSMCARFWELEQAGLIEKTDRERPTSSRRPAAVYVRRHRS